MKEILNLTYACLIRISWSSEGVKCENNTFSLFRNDEYVARTGLKYSKCCTVNISHL